MYFSIAKAPIANRVVAASIPGMYLFSGDGVSVGEMLLRLAESAAAGALPVSAVDARVDVEASLWFLRAMHVFAKKREKEGGGDGELIDKLRQTARQMVQQFISEQGVGGMIMDHGGMLTAAPSPFGQQPNEVLRLNALWYSALDATAADLKAAGDRSGDHFDRLAGRFRRTFVKTFWCDAHCCICPPHTRQTDSHGELPEPDQLLLSILPASPLPRTKQRQMVQTLQERVLKGCETGIWMQHPTLGRVESIVHRAWLALSMVNCADNRAAAVPQARAVLAPLEPLLNSATGIAAFYRDGKPLCETDTVTTAEVMGAVGTMRSFLKS
ncbi:MAG: hypothetical protein FWD61_11415 [Phycisphaerales bacterium]|nr:hypothetical protein [Phycisphaerales bacterium]